MFFARFFFTLFAACALTTSAAFANVNESGGLVVMEVESAPTAGDWKKERSVGGFKGSGYYVWRGADAFNVNSAGRGKLTYRFRINKAGNYQLRWRSRITEGNNQTESNDSWVRFPTGRNVPGEKTINTWTKVYMNSLNKWSWTAVTVDNVGRPIRQYFSKGDHVMEISGRSRGHGIDQIVLYHYQSVSFSNSKFENLTPSNNASGPAPQPAPQPAPEPTPAPAPQPAPEPTPAPVQQPAPAAAVVDPNVNSVDGLVARVYSRSSAELFWDRQSELGVTYRIAVNGDTRDTTDGTSYYFDDLQEGREYAFSVTTISSSGAESEPVVVNAVTGTPATFGDDQPDPVEEPAPSQQASSASADSNVDSVEGLYIDVYSRSAAELFWDRQNEVGVSYRIAVNGVTRDTTDGTSYYFDDLTEGRPYVFSVTTISSSGTESASVLVNASTGTPGSVSASSGGDNANDDSGNQTGSSVQSPQNASLVRYSSSVAELFWDRPATIQNIVGTDVYRDGNFLTTEDGTSYYDDNRVSGQDYEYSLIAIDGAGNRSEPTIVRP